MTFLGIKRPINFQWVILMSLIFFSFFPIFVLEVIQVLTLPQQLEQDEINKSKSQLNFAADLIQQSILSDANKLALLAGNEDIIEYLLDNTSIEKQNAVLTTLSDFVNLTSKYLPSLPIQDKHQILEVGVDLIESYSPSSTDFSNDKLKRLVSLSYESEVDEYLVQSNQSISGIGIENYYPYYQIKSFYPGKIHYSSSIRQRTNFMTLEAIRDEEQNPIPINVHSRLLQDNNGNLVGHLYSVISAAWILELIDELSKTEKPAILTNRAGTVFYSNNTLGFIEVTGYYKSILEAGFDTTIDRTGYKGEITIYRHIALDLEQNQTLLIAKVLPRNVIFSSFQKAIVQAAITLIVSVALATLLAFFMTRTITKRIQQVTVAADQISKGDFGVKLDLNGSDAIATLNQSFDRMTKRLKIYIQEEE